jgi:hypothetical protein
MRAWPATTRRQAVTSSTLANRPVNTPRVPTGQVGHRNPHRETTSMATFSRLIGQVQRCASLPGRCVKALMGWSYSQGPLLWVSSGPPLGKDNMTLSLTPLRLDAALFRLRAWLTLATSLLWAVDCRRASSVKRAATTDQQNRNETEQAKR